MANADFSRQQNQPTGGFDASSYRAAAPAEEEVRLTPFQQKLASLEKALPAALSKQAVAVALCIVVMLGCFVGFGGAKLRAKYDTVKNGFTTGVAADSGYTLNEELTTRLNTAANIITTASNTLGADSTEVQTAQAALDSFSACLGAVQSDGKIHAPDSLSVYTGGRMHMLLPVERDAWRSHRPALRKIAGAGRRPHEDGRSAGAVQPVQQCADHHQQPAL